LIASVQSLPTAARSDRGVHSYLSASAGLATAARTA
jgi:hypothetical protein